MSIKSLYKDYFQKSRVFLYPLLDIKRGGSVTPIETYVSWKGNYTLEDAKLICLYHLRDDDEFKRFETSKLFNNKLIQDFKQVDDNKGVYVFDLSEHKADWKCFVGGKYSQFSTEHKRKVLNFMGRNDSNTPYIESFLHPDKYFKLYAEMIHVKESLLREVGELLDPPDIKKESLEITIKKLELS